ncbi:hypothetical protein PoB_005370600 [Plakobranchus ocellatus]|uniref:Uncharacterized protein n=1 Tax=Plakobranchus ocellatus TaxID=259542 RepID=A0AAV4C373_9GAST|nr:hypothetical protein PoB_005370600 [Plakobranchus ocellatus]
MIGLEKRNMFYVYSSTLHEADGRHRAPVCPCQYPPPGIPKARHPVCLREYPPPGIPKASPFSPPSPISPTRDTESQCSRSPCPIISPG